MMRCLTYGSGCSGIELMLSPERLFPLSPELTPLSPELKLA